GYDDDFIATIQSHWSEMSGVTRETLAAKVLHASDEMCGFMVACALVRDPKGFTMEVKSVKKKFKDKGFAKAISRAEAPLAAQELGLAFDQHIANLIAGMAKHEAQLNEMGKSLL
ncbi:MAG: HAD family hydrolase, partial [Anaerovorax sp.]